MDGLFIFFVPENVGNLTIQGGAEGVQGFGRHGLALLDPVDRVRGKAKLINQGTVLYSIRDIRVFDRENRLLIYPESGGCFEVTLREISDGCTDIQ